MDEASGLRASPIWVSQIDSPDELIHGGAYGYLYGKHMRVCRISENRGCCEWPVASLHIFR